MLCWDVVAMGGVLHLTVARCLGKIWLTSIIMDWYFISLSKLIQSTCGISFFSGLLICVLIVLGK